MFADRSAVTLKRGHLHVTASLQLAHDGCRCPHPCRDDGLRQCPLFANGCEPSREFAASVRLGDKLRKLRVGAGAFRNDLRYEVPGHGKKVYTSNAIASTL